jgi:membrane-associated PAP2 superfamily phosphatase
MKVRVHIENEYIQVVRTQHGKERILNDVYLGRISPAGHASHGFVNVALSSVEGT